MSGKIKKRKLIIESSDEEESGAGDVKVVENKKASSSLSEKKKMKRIPDNDDDGDGSENEFSISDIKKKAKSRAKRLAEGIDEEPSASAKNKKTPPSDKKVNNILNYFKPLGGNKKAEETKTESPEKTSNKSNSDTTIESRNEVSDDFTFTYVKSKNFTKPGKNDNRMDVDFDNDIVKEKNSKEKKKVDKIEVKEDRHVVKETHREKKKEEKKSEKHEHKGEESYISPKKAKRDDRSRKESPEGQKSSKKSHSVKDEAKICKKEDFKESHKVKMSPKKSFVPVEALPRIKEDKRTSDLWVDKYKPDSLDKVIGQHGDRSSLKKLVNWLRNWHKNQDKKPAFGKWGADDGSGFKAALLSGPPGIGKTTSAQLACKELGFHFLEMNASCARNKRSLNEHVRELLNNTKMTDFFNAEVHKETGQKLTAKHCLIMDEVDGMAGNEDRGGISELIQLIKGSKVPIICICNDRGNQKMRSLVNYCFDLRFYKPKVDQIKGMLMKIVFREKLQITQDVLTEIIISSNNDIRQSIHNLALLAIAHTKIDSMISKNEKPTKDVRLGPFDAIKKVFSTGEEYASMSFIDKSDLFFCDYSIMPLFVHENYNRVNLSSKEPSTAKQLKRLCASIDAISFGDLIDREVRTNQNWSLLPMQAAFSTVMPGAYIRSSSGLGMPQFPQFMGKLSTTNKNRRTVGDLLSHMMLSVNGNSTALALDYMDPLRNQLIDPLLQGQAGVSSVLDTMESYSMVKEDMDSILGFGLWAGDTDPMKSVDSKTKAALTRAYNKKDFALPYATDRESQAVTKKGKAAGSKGKSKAKSNDESSEEEYYEDELAEGLDFY